MLWAILLRTSIVVSLALTAKQIYDAANFEISPTRIYNTHQVARFLGVDRKVVISLVKKRKINGKTVNGNYKIPGQSVLEYLNKK